MRILLCHNRYQNRGGEDVAFDAERTLLTAAGHDVASYVRSNDELKDRSAGAAAPGTVWNRHSYAEVLKLCRDHQPAVMHVHNTLAVLSPSIYWAAHRAGVPVVQTIHNYRLVCPNALFYRAGAPCTLCARRAFAWPGIRYACYRDNRAATAVVATTQWVHRLLGTWSRRIDHFITLSRFAAERLSAGGVPREKLSVLPNFTTSRTDPGHERAAYALYVGRLSEEKGIGLLLEAWAGLPDVPLRIAGDGPLLPAVQAMAARNRNVTALGWQSPDAVQQLLAEARFLIVPSTCYEGFPMILAEGMAAGVPVIGARIGAIEEIVEENGIGFLFPPGEPARLAEAVRTAFALPASALESLRLRCRAAHGARYTPEVHLDQLLRIYERAAEKHDAKPSRPSTRT